MASMLRKFRVLSIESNFITTSRTMYEVMQVCVVVMLDLAQKFSPFSHSLELQPHDQEASRRHEREDIQSACQVCTKCIGKFRQLLLPCSRFNHSPRQSQSLWLAFEFPKGQENEAVVVCSAR